jgi:hypothetical protein
MIKQLKPGMYANINKLVILPAAILITPLYYHL